MGNIKGKKGRKGKKKKTIAKRGYGWQCVETDVQNMAALPNTAAYTFKNTPKTHTYTHESLLSIFALHCYFGHTSTSYSNKHIKRFVRSHRISYSFTFPGLTETWLLTCMRREPGAPERRTCWRRNKGRRGSRTSPPPGKESGQLSWPCLGQNLRGDRSYSPGEERKDLPEYT